MMRLTEPLFTLMPELVATSGSDHLRAALAISGRDLILLLGGLFLLWKSAHEIHESMEADPAQKAIHVPSRNWMVLAQIAVIDIVFSLDSVITAVGMASHVPVMVLAARAIGDFVDAHPSIKILALSFLILIGVVLIAEGLGQHLPKGYIYFAMAFSVAVEMLNIRIRRKRAEAAGHALTEPVHLHTAPHADSDDDHRPSAGMTNKAEHTCLSCRHSRNASRYLESAYTGQWSLGSVYASGAKYDRPD